MQHLGYDLAVMRMAPTTFRRRTLPFLLIAAVLGLGAAPANALTKDQVTRAAGWYAAQTERETDLTDVKILGCRERPRSWLCQVSAFGDSILLNPDGSPMQGIWRWAVRVTGRGCRVVVSEADGARWIYRACPTS